MIQMKMDAGFEILNNIRNNNLRHTIIKGEGALDNTGLNYYKHLSPNQN